MSTFCTYIVMLNLFITFKESSTGSGIKCIPPVSLLLLFQHPNRSMRERCTSHVNNCDRNRKWIPLEYQLLSWLHRDSSAMEVCNGILMSMSQLLSCLQSELPMGDIHYGIYPIIVNPVVFIVAVVTGMLHHQHNKSCALNLWSNIIRVQV